MTLFNLTLRCPHPSICVNLSQWKGDHGAECACHAESIGVRTVPSCANSAYAVQTSSQVSSHHFVTGKLNLASYLLCCTLISLSRGLPNTPVQHRCGCICVGDTSTTCSECTQDMRLCIQTERHVIQGKSQYITAHSDGQSVYRCTVMLNNHWCYQPKTCAL